MDRTLTSTPADLTCAACDDPISGAAYLPATETDEGYDPLPGAAVCDDCGYNAVGMQGCAPELAEVTDPGPDDVLLFVRRTDGGLEIVTVKD